MIARVIDDKLINVIMETYNSPSEVLNMSNSRKQIRGDFDRDDINSSRTGIENWATVEDYCRNGWKESTQEFNETINDIKQVQSEKRISFKNDIQGYMPIVPLTIIGVPNNMVNSHYKEIKTKCIKVIYNVNYGAMVRAETIKKNSKKLLSVLYGLELQGYRIELYVCYFVGNGKKFNNMTIRIKEANQPFAMERMMYPLRMAD